MKTTHLLRACGGALLSTAILLALAPASRADLVYNVTLTMNSAFVADSNSANGPFSLDFDLATGTNTGGAGNVTNTVKLSNFVVTNGSLAGSSNYTQGGESGSLASSLTLTNSSLNNEFAEAFTLTQAGTITFQVDETTNSESLTVSQIGQTPVNDQFSMFIDDNNSVTNNYVATADSANSTVISSELETGANSSSVKTFNSVSPDAGLTAVPEPGSAALLLFGAVGLVVRRKRTSEPHAA